MPMYRLLLTREERRAIDWVGNRDWTGDFLYTSLFSLSTCVPDVDWDADTDIEFQIPVRVAWDIRKEWIQNECFIPYFSDILKEKLTKLLLSIV